jgi:hypothetical protein
MSSLPRRCWQMRIVLPCAIVLLFAASLQADPKPLSKEEQAKVDKAIERGVRYLKQLQRPSGTIPNESRANLPDHPSLVVGYTLLPALTLLECRVPPDDPVIQKAASLLRKQANKLECTYELSLAIMFLDRLGERKDVEIIRYLALRLAAGQSYTGGWTYRCPRLTADQEKDLLKSLRALQEHLSGTKQPPRDGKKPGDGGRDAQPEAPPQLAKLAVFQKTENLFDRKETHGKDRSILYVGWTDNSNTQFAMLALWIARRHDLPLVPTFRLVERRFECSQGDDGTWDYLYQFGGLRARRPYYVADTGVGLLGLGIGRVTVAADKETQERLAKQIVRGLAALSRDIGDPMEQPNFYLLWTIERVATLYNLQAFADKDWYRWGTEILVASQDARGCWPHHADMAKGIYGSNPNTSFALLFLKRSNLAMDLTAKLPFKSKELNKSIMALHAASPSGGGASSSHESKRKLSSTPPP